VAGVPLGQLIYHLRDLLLLGLVGGFVTLILNPVVVSLQHWGVKRRGGAVAIVTFVALLIFLVSPSCSATAHSTASRISRRRFALRQPSPDGQGWIDISFAVPR